MRKNNDRTQKRESRKETLLETLKLPKDICMGALKVTLTGNREAWISGCICCVKYSDGMNP